MHEGGAFAGHYSIYKVNQGTIKIWMIMVLLMHPEIECGYIVQQFLKDIAEYFIALGSSLYISETDW